MLKDQEWKLQKSNRKVTDTEVSQWGPKSSIDRMSASVIRAAGDRASIDSASSVNPRGSRTTEIFRVRSKASAVSGATTFCKHSGSKAYFTVLRSAAQWSEKHAIKGNNAGKNNSFSIIAPYFSMMVSKLWARDDESWPYVIISIQRACQTSLVNRDKVVILIVEVLLVYLQVSIIEQGEKKSHIHHTQKIPALFPRSCKWQSIAMLFLWTQCSW